LNSSIKFNLLWRWKLLALYFEISQARKSETPILTIKKLGYPNYTEKVNKRIAIWAGPGINGKTLFEKQQKQKW
jgi:hypothetical protein